MGQLIAIDQLIIISGVINALLTSSFSSLQLYALWEGFFPVTNFLYTISKLKFLYPLNKQEILIEFITHPWRTIA